MGAMCSAGDEAPADPNDQGKKRDNELQKELERDRMSDRGVKKLLLLGPGNSGKSTFFKQLLQIHGTGFTDKHIFDAKKSIYDCVILQMKNVINQAKQFKYSLSDDMQESADYISELPPNSEVTQPIADAIEKLWKNEQIQLAFHNRSNLGIVDSADYFFNQIKTIARNDYIPSKDDILFVRTPTTGVIKSTFLIEKHSFEIYDVGGQRSERSKWIHCFDTVTAILFVASLSSYDQGLYEQEHINAMHEALQLFEEIVNSRWFRLTSMILFLNKSDLFETKIAEKELKVCFPDYSGPKHDYKASIEYIRKQFENKSQNKSGTHNIYSHVTCATNQDNVRRVFKDVQHIVVTKSLGHGGLM